MHALIQTDAAISAVLMRALIHRRIAMVVEGIGDVLLIGSVYSAATLRIKQFLTRNDHPFKYLDLDRDADVRDVLDRFRVDLAELPVVICRAETVLKNPPIRRLPTASASISGSAGPAPTITTSRW